MIESVSKMHTSYFEVPRPTDVVSFLKEQVGLSQIRAEELIRFGALYLNGLRLQKAQALKPGDVLRVHFRPKRFPASEIPILYQDDDVVIVDKPAGLPTHPTLDNALENAAALTSEQIKHRLFVTSRLDVATAGVLIFAKTTEIQAKINGLFRDRKVKKIYRAMTTQPVAVGRYEHFMNLEMKPPKAIVTEMQPGFVNAILSITKTWDLKEGFACEIELETGRTHQIRAQLGLLGAPVVGDILYGAPKKFALERIALECYHINFALRSRTIGIYRPTPLVAPPVY
jgi:23S rRNA pseudouridine1911/1915/1917 synthase